MRKVPTDEKSLRSGGCTVWQCFVDTVWVRVVYSSLHSLFNDYHYHPSHTVPWSCSRRQAVKALMFKLTKQVHHPVFLWPPICPKGGLGYGPVVLGQRSPQLLEQLRHVRGWGVVNCRVWWCKFATRSANRDSDRRPKQFLHKSNVALC